MTRAFRDRADAGRRLAARLRDVSLDNVVVLALPRGGVPVAAEVARALDAPLDIIVVRKLGVPDQPELAMGAIGEGGVRLVDERVVAMARVGSEQIAAVEVRERAELARRAAQFRGVRPRVPLRERTALLVDDGIATGSTMRAACAVARAMGARRVVAATPVAPTDAIASLHEVADDVIAVESPRRFFAIGEFYDDFTQTTDAEVVQLLAPDPGLGGA